MKFEVMTITPEMAEQMLEKNIPTNRKKKKRNISRWALIMRNGGWRLVHQGIAFDKDGNLCDGQNRLYAVVLAGVPVRFVVAYYEEGDDDPLYAIDTGTVRTFRDQQHINGEPEWVEQMESIAYSLMMMHGITANILTAETMANFMKANESVFRGFYDLMDGKLTKIPAPVMGALLLAYANGADADGIKRFVSLWRTNDVEGSAKYNARALLNFRQNVKASLHRNRAGLAKMQGMIRAYLNNYGRSDERIWYPMYGVLDTTEIDKMQPVAAARRKGQLNA